MSNTALSAVSPILGWKPRITGLSTDSSSGYKERHKEGISTWIRSAGVELQHAPQVHINIGESLFFQYGELLMSIKAMWWQIVLQKGLTLHSCSSPDHYAATIMDFYLINQVLLKVV